MCLNLLTLGLALVMTLLNLQPCLDLPNLPNLHTHPHPPTAAPAPGGG